MGAFYSFLRQISTDKNAEPSEFGQFCVFAWIIKRTGDGGKRRGGIKWRRFPAKLNIAADHAIHRAIKGALNLLRELFVNGGHILPNDVNGQPHHGVAVKMGHIVDAFLTQRIGSCRLADEPFDEQLGGGFQILRKALPVFGVVEVVNSASVLPHHGTGAHIFLCKGIACFGALCELCDFLIEQSIHQGGNIFIVIVKGVSIDVCLFNDVLDRDFIQGLLRQQVNKCLCDNCLCPSGHKATPCGVVVSRPCNFMQSAAGGLRRREIP